MPFFGSEVQVLESSILCFQLVSKIIDIYDKMWILRDDNCKIGCKNYISFLLFSNLCYFKSPYKQR